MGHERALRSIGKIEKSLHEYHAGALDPNEVKLNQCDGQCVAVGAFVDGSLGDPPLDEIFGFCGSLLLVGLRRQSSFEKRLQVCLKASNVTLQMLVLGKEGSNQGRCKEG